MTLTCARKRRRSIPLSIKLAHIRQSCSESGHDYKAKNLQPFQVLLFRWAAAHESLKVHECCTRSSMATILVHG